MALMQEVACACVPAFQVQPESSRNSFELADKRQCRVRVDEALLNAVYALFDEQYGCRNVVHAPLAYILRCSLDMSQIT
jgi:hypothetical protein